MKIKHHKIDVNGIGVFYREAGSQDAPTLLLHGFPSAGHMFRDLIPLLADKYCLFVPDLPGFGQTDLPGRRGHSAVSAASHRLSIGRIFRA